MKYLLQFEFEKDKKSQYWLPLFINLDSQELAEGGVFHVPALMPVMLQSLTDDSAIAETSNNNNAEDIYRLG